MNFHKTHPQEVQAGGGNSCFPPVTCEPCEGGFLCANPSERGHQGGRGFRELRVRRVYLEDHPMTCKWLITMVIVSALRIGLWDPFQMGELHGL